MASSAMTFKSMAVVFVAVFFFAAVASPQDLGLSPSPAPGPDVGAAGSVSSSVAMIGASIVLSMLALLNHWTHTLMSQRQSPFVLSWEHCWLIDSFCTQIIYHCCFTILKRWSMYTAVYIYTRERDRDFTRSIYVFNYLFIVGVRDK